MKKIKLIGMLLAFVITIPAMAFSTNEERIDGYLSILATGNMDKKEKMLSRLQWSGLTDPRLYDDIEERVQTQYLERNLDKKQMNLVAYQIRALGYSGSEKYRSTLTQVSKDAFSSKLKRHAKKALNDLSQFATWNQLIADSDLVVEGKSIEIATYMKMLSVDDYFVQRLAARAMYAESSRDTDLLDLAAQKLKELYLKEGLDGEWQDTASWLCKAIGQSGQSKYITLLAEVAAETPYRKINKYAGKYTRQVSDR